MCNENLKDCRIRIIGDIQTKQRPRFNTRTGTAYTPKDTANYENYIRTEYRRQTEDMWFADQPLGAVIKAYFRPSREMAKLDGYERILNVGVKDCDNIAKIVLDSLNGIAYQDDKQVCEVFAQKRFSQTDQEYIDVFLYELPTETIPGLKLKARREKLRAREDELLGKLRNGGLTKQEFKALERVREQMGRNY